MNLNDIKNDITMLSKRQRFLKKQINKDYKTIEERIEAYNLGSQLARNKLVLRALFLIYGEWRGKSQNVVEKSAKEPLSEKTINIIKSRYVIMHNNLTINRINTHEKDKDFKKYLVDFCKMAAEHDIPLHDGFKKYKEDFWVISTSLQNYIAQIRYIIIKLKLV